MKVRVSPSGKEPWLAEVFSEVIGNMEWIAEGGGVNTSYDHETTYKIKDSNYKSFLLIVLWIF